LPSETALEKQMTVNYELERMWKEAKMALFMAIEWHLPGKAEEKKDSLSRQTATRQ
jgi:hypothetical protein